MLRKLSTLLALTVQLIFSGCESESPLLPDDELVVVRAYLYAGEPVTEVQLTTTFSLASHALNGQPINDAKMTLQKGGASFALVPSPGDSGYYHYGGSALHVNIGDHFQLRIERNGRVATGETVIPPPPLHLALSDSVWVVDASSPGDTSSLNLSWEGGDTYYFVRVDNLESSPEPIGSAPLSGGLQAFRSRPIRAHDYALRRSDLHFFGEHRARVYTVNQEYADLYAFGQQDSRNLNEPETNLKQGLGIFAGFSSAEVRFRVERK